jgi:hypothetical protein
VSQRVDGEERKQTKRDSSKRHEFASRQMMRTGGEGSGPRLG